MREVFNWCVENWRIVLEVVLLIGSVVILILKKKPITDINSVIYELCIFAINFVEKQGRSPDKLEKATNYVLKDLSLMFPNLKVSCYENFIKKVIENILTTPQKK